MLDVSVNECSELREVRRGYAHELRCKRTFIASPHPTDQIGLVYSRTPVVGGNVGQHTTRVARILEDRETEVEERRNGLNHLLEYHALRGLRNVSRHLTRPGQYHIEYVLAPPVFEKGEHAPYESGADILLSYVNGGGEGPRPISMGINIKSQTGSQVPCRYWYGHKICAPAFALPVGSWVPPESGHKNVRRRVIDATESNEKAREFIRFMNTNEDIFGGYLLQQIASAARIYLGLAEKFGHLRHCCPEWKHTFPEGSHTFRETMGKVSRLVDFFELNGIKPLNTEQDVPPDERYRVFHPTHNIFSS